MTIPQVLKLLPPHLVVTDSRYVEEGGCFVCVCDSYEESRIYIQKALDKGALFIVCGVGHEKPFQEKFKKISFFPCSSPRFILSELSHFLHPNHPPYLAAVTGTNGKSSVVSFMRQLFGLNNICAASVGTLGVVTTHAQKVTMSPLTTPGALELHKLLEQLASINIEVAALEASSHGLHQYRLHHVPLACAGFTNLSQDHLDYHKTMENYFQAKCQLFSEVLGPGKVAVLNKDSDFFHPLTAICEQRRQHVVSYSLHEQADLRILNLLPTATGFTFDLNYEGQTYENLRTSLIGQFQLENLLCATGLALACGMPIHQCVNVFHKVMSVDGRMDCVGTKNNAHIYVDYAHTPDALEMAIKSLRNHCEGNLWVVFGCGGNRDTQKRPLMGHIAYQHADQVIVTDDNPRFENPAHIRGQIIKTCPNAKEIADRQEAIAFAIAELKPGDVLLVAGKGHERGQTIGSETFPFYDKDIIQTYLEE